MKPYRGFTLIEMLIVIVIIGILGSVLYPKLMGFMNKTRTNLTKMELQQIQRIIYQAQSNTDKTLFQITNSSCTGCKCKGANTIEGKIESINSFTCLEGITSAMDKIITVASNETKAPLELYTDSRGRPYLLDENEGQPNRPFCESSDHISSVGPDGLWSTADDIFLQIRPYNCSGAF